MSRTTTQQRRQQQQHSEKAIERQPTTPGRQLVDSSNGVSWVPSTSSSSTKPGMREEAVNLQISAARGEDGGERLKTAAGHTEKLAALLYQPATGKGDSETPTNAAALGIFMSGMMAMSTTATSTTTAAGKQPELPPQQDTNGDETVWSPVQPMPEEEESSQDDADIDLSNYAPPEILTQLHNADATAEIIAMVVQSSLDNIVGQVEAERQRRVEQAAASARDAEAQAAVEAEQGKGKGRAEENDSIDGGSFTALPIIKVSSSEDTPPAAAANIRDNQEEATAVAPISPHRRSRFGNIRRIFNHIVDKPLPALLGTSAAGISDYRPPSSAGDATSSHVHLGSSHRPSLQRFIKTRPRKSSEALSLGPETMIECVACLGDFARKEAIKVPCHYYCTDCFERLIATALETEAQWPPKCCLNAIPYRTIAKHIRGDTLKLYKEKDEEYKVPVADRIYCSEPDCGEWIRKFDKLNKTARCSKGHVMCVMCRQRPHAGREACPQDRDQQILDDLAGEQGWRRCHQCSAMVEHREACQHMTCRCGAQFCYVCGLRWRTCHCTPQQLNAIKERAQQAQLARAEREARQATEDAWLQNALRLIEEYEREERTRKEEAAARREERRRREAERREEIRIAELAFKYGQLHADLADLEDWQRMELLRDHSREFEERRAVAIEERNAVWQRISAERSELRSETAAKITNQELESDREYRVRVAWEQQLEEEYATALKTFWAGKPGGPEQMGQAMRLYMRKNDARMEAWQKMRAREMEAFRYAAEEELGVREELWDTMMSRAHRTAEDKQEEVKRKHAAKLRWFELVVVERNRLLAEMEMFERETGAESDEGEASWMSLTDGEADAEVETPLVYGSSPEVDSEKEIRIVGGWPLSEECG
ncbi:hypothetical protein B0H66DRAFT_634878 [Apodospora peruviana]|uniref:RBR-type E3 ubiquitin transferase n=1 Tax=Apodospora peruviana TaxID=516989 RepID=A0AAE0IR32_9PEZI|nr:hypothetical protein B0H66DRAFT_634878 [Apodospora peruviana]